MQEHKLQEGVRFRERHPVERDKAHGCGKRRLDEIAIRHKPSHGRPVASAGPTVSGGMPVVLSPDAPARLSLLPRWFGGVAASTGASAGTVSCDASHSIKP